jgi:hypothetical protein
MPQNVHKQAQAEKQVAHPTIDVYAAAYRNASTNNRFCTSDVSICQACNDKIQSDHACVRKMRHLQVVSAAVVH